MKCTQNINEYNESKISTFRSNLIDVFTALGGEVDCLIKSNKIGTLISQSINNEKRNAARNAVSRVRERLDDKLQQHRHLLDGFLSQSRQNLGTFFNLLFADETTEELIARRETDDGLTSHSPPGAWKDHLDVLKDDVVGFVDTIRRYEITQTNIDRQLDRMENILNITDALQDNESDDDEYVDEVISDSDDEMDETDETDVPEQTTVMEMANMPDNSMAISSNETIESNDWQQHFHDAMKGRWTRLGKILSRRRNINIDHPGRIPDTLRQLLSASKHTLVNTTTQKRMRRKGISYLGVCIAPSQKLSAIRSTNLAKLPEIVPKTYNSDKVVAVSYGAKDLYCKIVSDLVDAFHNEVIHNTTKEHPLMIRGVMWGDSTGKMGQKGHLFAITHGVMYDPKLFKKPFAIECRARYLSFLGYLKEHTCEFDQVLEDEGQNIFDCSRAVQELLLKDGTVLYFRVMINRIKGDAPFLQQVIGNNTGNADDACYLCDSSKKIDWCPSGLGSHVMKSIYRCAMISNEIDEDNKTISGIKRFPPIMLAFKHRLDETVVKEYWDSVMIVADSLHYQKNHFESWRPCLDVVLNDVDTTTKTEISNREKECLNGGNALTLKKNRYYKKLLENVMNNYISPLDELKQKLIQKKMHNTAMRIDMIQYYIRYTAEISMLLNRAYDEITAEDMLRMHISTYNKYQMCAAIWRDQNKVKLYEHIEYEHLPLQFQSKEQLNNTTDQDEAIWRSLRTMHHCLGGRMYYESNEENNENVPYEMDCDDKEMQSELHSCILESGSLKKWDSVPKFIELALRKLPIHKELNNLFGPARRDECKSSVASRSNYEWLDLKIPLKYAVNTVSGQKWNMFVNRIWDIVNEMTSAGWVIYRDAKWIGFCKQSDLEADAGRTVVKSLAELKDDNHQFNRVFIDMWNCSDINCRYDWTNSQQILLNFSNSTVDMSDSDSDDDDDETFLISEEGRSQFRTTFGPRIQHYLVAESILDRTPTSQFATTFKAFCAGRQSHGKQLRCTKGSILKYLRESGYDETLQLLSHVPGELRNIEWKFHLVAPTHSSTSISTPTLTSTPCLSMTLCRSFHTEKELNISVILGVSSDLFTSCVDNNTGCTIIEQFGLNQDHMNIIRGCSQLHNNGWIDARSIEANLTLLCARYSDVQACVLSSYLLDDLNNRNRICPSHISNTSEARVILHMFNNGGHWNLGVNIVNQGVGLFLDSLGSTVSYEQFCDFIQQVQEHELCPTHLKKETSWYNCTHDIRFQIDSMSCGVFVMMFAELLLIGCNIQEIVNRVHSILSESTSAHDQLVRWWREMIAKRLSHYLAECNIRNHVVES